MNSKKYITELHQDHKEWSQELNFYADDLKIMQNELASVSSKNTSVEVKVRVEQFQNRFIIQEDEISILRKTINNEEQLITDSVIGNPTATDHRKLSDNNPLRDRIEAFAPIFKELRSDFKNFLVEVE